MSNKQNEQNILTRWVTFKLASEIYGVAVEKVREILRINDILPVPGSPDYVLGITNIRGNVVTVIDTRKRMGLLTEEPTELSRMIVLESNDDIVAIVVDKVSDIVELDYALMDSNLKMNTNDESRFINGVVTHLEELLIIIDVEKLITEDQFEMASGF